jgi:hypothetical protein
MDEEERSPIFECVRYTIIPSDDLPSDKTRLVGSDVGLESSWLHVLTDEQLRECLDDEGAEYVSLGENGAIPALEDLSHIISTHIDFPQYTSALSLGIDVVRPMWVHVSVKKEKMTNARPYSPDPSQYFQDVVLTSATLPEGDKEAIMAGVLALGGQFSNPLTKLCTHIVTTDESHEKCVIARAKGINCKILLPHWFDICLKLGKKINEGPYLFPDPEILKHDLDKLPKVIPSPHLEDASTDHPVRAPDVSPPSSPSEMRKSLNAFAGKQVYLCGDLQLSVHLRATLEAIIRQGGGTLTNDVTETDVYIGRYREGPEYLHASRSHKEVASLAWLYHVINRNHWSCPTNKLLHYPVPKQGLPGFENMKISVSNYSGEARIYLETLVRHCGAEFTKTFKQDNTHLITAHEQSEKVDAAKEWNINIINHLWLEESYAKCTVMPLSCPKYTLFPLRSNLGEVCGNMSLDLKQVERKFFPKEATPSKPVTKRSPQKASDATSHTLSDHNQNSDAPVAPEDAETEEDEPQEPEEPEEPKTVKKRVGRPSKSASLATPRPAFDEKENQSPITSTGRASKVKAMGAIHSAAEDIALFDREMKRKGGVVHGGRRSSHLDEQSSPAPMAPPTKKSKKRTSAENTYDVTAQGSDLSDGETQKPTKPTKKAKISKDAKDRNPSLPPVVHKMMVTGDERWVGKPKKEDEDRKTLRLLGVQLTQDPKDVDILVAPKILRTPKFVCALASAPLVVDTNYLDAALKQKKLLEDPATLKDRDAEKRMGFVLTEALDRAKINDHKLFRGWSIFVTRDIPGTFDTFKSIITLNGGNPMMYQGRTGTTIPKRRLRDDPSAGGESQHQGGDEEYDHVYLVSGTSEPEQKLWKSFTELAAKQDLEARIVKSDWLLHAAMSQQITWKDMWELKEGAV